MLKILLLENTDSFEPWMVIESWCLLSIAGPLQEKGSRNCQHSYFYL